MNRTCVNEDLVALCLMFHKLQYSYFAQVAFPFMLSSLSFHSSDSSCSFILTFRCMQVPYSRASTSAQCAHQASGFVAHSVQVQPGSRLWPTSQQCIVCVVCGPHWITFAHSLQSWLLNGQRCNLNGVDILGWRSLHKTRQLPDSVV